MKRAKNLQAADMCRKQAYILKSLCKICKRSRGMKEEFKVAQTNSLMTNVICAFSHILLYIYIYLFIYVFIYR